ncbi:hypothetical protein EI94DRAFT_1633225, partial [Lactarius quietus]
KAPFPLAEDNWVNKDGSWGPRQTFLYFSNWSPEILQCLCTNHDVKLITNGMETKDITWYIAGYVSKNHVQSSNTSALLVIVFAFNCAYQRPTADSQTINTKLIQ